MVIKIAPGGAFIHIAFIYHFKKTRPLYTWRGRYKESKHLRNMEFALFQKDYQYGNEPIQDLSGVRFSIAIISYEQCHGSNRQIVKT